MYQVNFHTNTPPGKRFDILLPIMILLGGVFLLGMPACHDHKEIEALQEEASSRLMMVHEGCYRLTRMQPGMLDSRKNFTRTLDSLLQLPRVINRVEQNDTLLEFLGHPEIGVQNRVGNAANELMIGHWKSILDNQPAADSLLNAYTSLLTCWFILGKTSRILAFPWYPGLKFSTATRENRLLVTGECSATHSFTLVFHALECTDLPEDPAWKLPRGFSIEPDDSYTVEYTAGESGRLTGKQLLEGLPVTWEPGKKNQLVIYQKNR